MQKNSELDLTYNMYTLKTFNYVTKSSLELKHENMDFNFENSPVEMLQTICIHIHTICSTFTCYITKLTFKSLIKWNGKEF